jgi:hypothetical protein
MPRPQDHNGRKTDTLCLGYTCSGAEKRESAASLSDFRKSRRSLPVVVATGRCWLLLHNAGPSKLERFDQSFRFPQQETVRRLSEHNKIQFKTKPSTGTTLHSIRRHQHPVVMQHERRPTHLRAHKATPEGQQVLLLKCPISETSQHHHHPKPGTVV